MKKITESKVMPKSGQFVAVWAYKGKMWSKTCRWVKGVLHEVIVVGTELQISNISGMSIPDSLNATFYK